MQVTAGEVALGLVLVAVAGAMQGSFVLPMTLTREWKWEHSWAAFSLLGMLVFNWGIGFAVLPKLIEAIRLTPSRDIVVLLSLGACWGVGAILFGLGMEKLGMAVGYPVIMGLILGLGALIPLAQTGILKIVTKPGLLLLAGTLVVLFGIVLCARAAALKDTHTRLGAPQNSAASTRGGVAIAILAGILSCLPNVGLNNAAELTAAVSRLGATPEMAGNAAWVVQFTAGFVVNFCYCAVLIARRRNTGLLEKNTSYNLALLAAMALMWIGSFYLYGMGAARMGRWGGILGWPLFISLAIVVGNLWGLWRGEWSSTTQPARTQLNWGLAAMLLAVVLFGLGSAID